MWFSCIFIVFWFIASLFLYFKGNSLIENNYRTNSELWGYGDRVDEVVKKVKKELGLCVGLNFLSSAVALILGWFLKINLDFLTMIFYIIIVVSIFYIYGYTEPASIGYKGEPIDKNITVKIWNYLALKDKNFNKFDLLFRRMTGVTIEEIDDVKKSLESMDKDDILDIKEAIELSKIGTISEFAFNSVKKYILALFTTIFSITSLTKIFETFFKGNISTNIDEIIKFFVSNALLSIVIVSSIFLIALIVLWWLNNLTSVNRRRHCNELLIKYIEVALDKSAN